METQGKIIEFVRSHFPNVDLCIHPDPDTKYRTRFGPAFDDSKALYPFDFYGVIPFVSTGILEHGQFIFDRSAGGCLVRILKLPDSFDVPPSEVISGTEDGEVVIMEGGYNRELGGDGFALLLNIVKLRWWPELEMGDDYNICTTVGNMIWQYGLARKMTNEHIDFETCMDLLVREHERRHPHISATSGQSKPHLRIIDPAAMHRQIGDLELSVRTHNCLAAMHIDTIGELLHYSEKDLLAFKNFGRKNLAELEDLLRDFGFYLKNE
ncbi:MAG TPA: DNA-directed RNA polymerase subunit alpha C-terminal domain-containing protein [Patescibacteria group bacterium]|nr:DNA-directed RNA polymerase subunit alpha C-terminal domain-containing protein [Patescibacteria group bacterium]